jgi:tetratricopeptide (TPR) repeat protein
MALAGRVDNSLGLLSAADERIRSGQHRFYQSLATIWLGDAMLRAGRAIDAQARAQEALHMCVTLGERGNEAYALHLLGDIALEIGDADGALEHYQAALSRASDLEMVTLAGQCHLALARCARRSAKDATAREHFAAANEIAERWGMVRLAALVRSEAAR